MKLKSKPATHLYKQDLFSSKKLSSLFNWTETLSPTMNSDELSRAGLSQKDTQAPKKTKEDYPCPF